MFKDGTKVTFDGRIFHKAGMDGVHHLEEDVEGFIEPQSNDPRTDEGRQTLLLMEETIEELKHPSLLDGLAIDPEDIESHPVIATVHEVDRPMNWDVTPTGVEE